MECLRLATFLLLVALDNFLQFGACQQPDYDTKETGRIIGGRNAKKGMFPWTVALYRKGKFHCTGSIISERAVLTAAHCLVSTGQTSQAKLFRGIAGDVKRSSKYVEHLNFVKVTPHPEFNKTGKIDNDVAILKTSKPIHFSKTIQQICIASPKIGQLVNKQVVAMGWGLIRRNSGKCPDILQYARQEVVSNSKCSFLRKIIPVPGTNVCTRESQSGISVGDSGGPLVFYKGRKPIQVGIASYTFHFERYRRYITSVFVRVSSYTNFIKNTAGYSVCVE